MDLLDGDVVGPAYSVVTCGDDMGKYVENIINEHNGKYNLLDKETVEELKTIQMLTPPRSFGRGGGYSWGWNVVEYEGDEPKDDRIGKAEHPASDSGDQAGGSAGEGLHHEIALKIAQDVSPTFKRVFAGTLAGDHPNLGGYRRDLHQNEDHGQEHEDRVLEQPDERVQGALDIGKEDIQIGELADLGDTDHRRFTGRFLDGRRCFRRSGRSV